MTMYDIIEKKKNKLTLTKEEISFFVNGYINKKIPDYLDNGFEQRKLAPSWRRMCICILKNDHLCTSLSFSQTKRQQERMKILIEKYKKL